MRPIQYLLVGFPYSGKTTIAKELENRLGFAHINIDQLKFDRGYTDVGDDEVPDNVWDDIFRNADDLIKEYLNQGKNVANEYAWITREWRDRARKVAEDAGFETKVIYVNPSEQVIRHRREINKKTKERFHWSDEEFERFFKDFEVPTSDEQIMIYDQKIPVEDWIHLTFR